MKNSSKISLYFGYSKFIFKNFTKNLKNVAIFNIVKVNCTHNQKVMKNYLNQFLFHGLLLFYVSASFGQIIEGKVNRYYVVVGSYNTKKLANQGIQKLEKAGKTMLFVLHSPNQKLYRICYAQAKTKSDILQLQEEAKQLYPNAWVLYL